jgi:D-alanyl-D-alanine carboxypeptidase (penicillin-binding protein 5/6)
MGSTVTRRPLTFHLHTAARTIALLVATAALLALVAAAAGPATAAAKAKKPPAVDAAAVAVMDVPTGRFIYQLNGDKKVAIASTTKIMTAWVTLLSDLKPEQEIVVPPLNLSWDEMDVNLQSGQTLTVDQLLQALLVASAGDAARTLAVAVAGGEEAFARRMNDEAAKLGLKNTHYVNSDGMDAPGHHSTADDLTRLARVAMEDPSFAAYVKMKSCLVPQMGKSEPARYPATNTLMLANDWVDGVKTGYTDDAGSCLVASGEYKGHRMIVTLLGAPDPQTRNADIAKLFKYAAGLYRTWKSPAAGFVYATATVPYSHTSLDVVLSSRYAVSLPPGTKVTSTVRAPAAAAPPVAGDQELGTVTYKVDGKKWEQRALLADREIPLANWQSRLRFRLGQIWTKGREAIAGSLRGVAGPAVRLPFGF